MMTSVQITTYRYVSVESIYLSPANVPGAIMGGLYNLKSGFLLSYG